MKEIISFVQNNPWVVVAVMSVMFYISLARLVYKRVRRQRAFKMLKSMENDGEVSKSTLGLTMAMAIFTMLWSAMMVKPGTGRRCLMLC